jgi:hypothetical protein
VKNEEKVRRERRKKEEKRKIELESKKRIELSERVNIAKRKDMKDAEEQQKKVMREQATQAKRVDAKKHKIDETTRKKEKNKRDKEIQEEVEATPLDEREAILKINKMKIKKIKETKGKCRAPKAEDEHGCKHSGLLGLMALPKNYLQAYVKEGDWLYKRPCKDCAAKEAGNREDNLVLDVASLLCIKGTQEVEYYCNCGLAGFGMEDGHEYKASWTCDMVLYMSCYNERTKKMSGDRSAKRSCRRSTRLD